MAWHWKTNLESSSLGPRYCVSIRQITKVLVLCYKSHFITFSCYYDHCKEIKLSSTMVQKSFQLCCKENDQIALEVSTKRFPKIGRYRHHKIQRCIHMNKKKTILRIWKYWIPLTVSWHWKANCNGTGRQTAMKIPVYASF